MGRRWIALPASIVLLLLVLWLRRNTDQMRFVVPSAAREVLYATTFDGTTYTGDWSQSTQSGGSITTDDDQLNLTFVEFVTARNLLRSTTPYLFRDFDYRVQAAANAGPLNNSYGVVFRQQDDATYYLFYVSSDGFYSVWRETPAGRIALSTWIPSEAINQGVNGETNTLRVVAQGDTFRFFINTEPVMLCVPDDPGGESTYSLGECVGGTMQETLTDATIPYGALGVVIETLEDGGMSAAFDSAVVLGPSS